VKIFIFSDKTDEASRM